jgi:outer membrane lipoprotein SlyB
MTKTYQVPAPDGTILEFPGPDDATPDQVYGYAQAQWKQIQDLREQAKTEPPGVMAPPRTASEVAKGYGAAAARGAAPYAVGAGVGGATAGIPGAIVGTSAVAGLDFAHAVDQFTGGHLHIPGVAENTDKILDWAGLPRPRTTGEKATEFGVGMMSGTRGPAKLLDAAASKIAKPTQMAENINEAQRAGAVPLSLGAVSPSRTMQYTESLLSRTPGASKPLEESSMLREAGVGRAAEEISSRLTTSPSAEKAGAALQKGIDAWYKGFRRQQDSLASKVSAKIPKDKPVEVTEIKRALDDMTQTIAGAEATTQAMVKPQIERWKKALDADLAPKPTGVLGADGKPTMGPARTTLPWAAVDKIRKEIGQALEPGSIFPDATKSQLKRLYAAASDDMEMSLPKGSPGRKEWEDLKSFTAKGHEHYETFLKPVANASIEERAAKIAMQNTKEGSAMLRGIIDYIPKAQRDEFIGNVIYQMGRQGKKEFSIETFATNWKNLHPDARALLFKDPRIAADMENLAKVAKKLQESGATFYNPSGTAKLWLHAGLATEFFREVVTGNAGNAAKIAGGVTIGKAAAMLMTNQKFIKWLADGPKYVGLRTGNWIAQLATMTANEKDRSQRQAMENILAAAKAKGLDKQKDFERPFGTPEPAVEELFGSW